MSGNPKPLIDWLVPVFLSASKGFTKDLPTTAGPLYITQQDRDHVLKVRAMLKKDTPHD